MARVGVRVRERPARRRAIRQLWMGADTDTDTDADAEAGAVSYTRRLWALR